MLLKESLVMRNVVFSEHEAPAVVMNDQMLFPFSCQFKADEMMTGVLAYRRAIMPRMLTLYTSRLSLPRSVRNASTFVGTENGELKDGLSGRVKPDIQDSQSCDHRDSKISQELDVQSDVNRKNGGDVDLLVDNNENAHNFEFWIELLKYREQRYGLSGVKDIFYGLKRGGIVLPTAGDTADELWSRFMNACTNDNVFRKELWNFAREQAKITGSWWSKFHVTLFSSILIQEPRRAAEWAKRIHGTEPICMGKETLQHLLEPAMSSEASLGAFRSILLRSPDCNLYGQLIPELCRRGLHKQALRYHYFLVKCGDLPTATADVELLAKHVAVYGDQVTFDQLRVSLVKINRTLAAPLANMHKERPDMPGEPVIDDENAEPVISSRRPISDATAARAFATTALSVKFIIKGLVSFNFQTLGKAAMRELAVRCDSVVELSDHLDRLKVDGVAVEDAVYTKLLQRLASTRNQSMFEAVKESDMHPDVYSDRDLQLLLLKQYSRQGDWFQLHRTLTVLTTLYHNPSEQAWNILLRGYMQDRDWHMTDAVLGDMIGNGVTATEQTIKKSFFMLLPTRNAGKAADTLLLPSGTDALSFLTSMWLRISGSGGRVPPYAWRQVLNHYGISGRFDELESLAYQLAWMYGPQNKSNSPSAESYETLDPETVHEKKHTLRRIQRFRPGDQTQLGLQEIFTPLKQRAIVEWGFKTLSGNAPTVHEQRDLRQMLPQTESNALTQAPQRSMPSHDSTSQWDRGLRLLKGLQVYGLRLDLALVQSTVRHRLRVLFHPDYASKRRENRNARGRNPFDLCTMIMRINDVLEQNVLGIPTIVLQNSKRISQPNLARVLLGLRPQPGSRSLPALHAPLRQTKVIEASLRQ
ncbi:MAG: hypothetical protein Q9159_002744 [Coniocarpon cinnabarinum]